MVWQGYQYITVEWLGLTLAFCFIAIRIYVDVTGLRKVAWYRDVIVSFAWLIWCAGVACESVENDNDYYNFDLPFTAEEAEYTAKINWANVFINNSFVYCCKLDLLFLFHGLAPRSHQPKIFWFIMVGWFFVIAGWLTQFFYTLLVCRPINLNWTYYEDLTMPDCTFNQTYYYTLWSLHFFSDMLLMIIPSVIIYRMQMMSFSQKLSAAAMFIVGFVNILTVLGSMFIAVLASKNFATDPEKSWALWGAEYFLGTLQNITLLLVICMPQLKPFYRLVRDKIRGGAGKEGDVESPRNGDESPPAGGGAGVFKEHPLPASNSQPKEKSAQANAQPVGIEVSPVSEGFQGNEVNKAGSQLEREESR